MDPLEGTWRGSKSIPFLASGSGKVTVKEDGTAFASIDATVLGKNHHIDVEHLQWEKIDDGSYIGEYKNKKVQLSLKGDVLSAVFNPYSSGLTHLSALNINIPFELKRIN